VLLPSHHISCCGCEQTCARYTVLMALGRDP